MNWSTIIVGIVAFSVGTFFGALILALLVVGDEEDAIEWEWEQE